MNYFGLRENDNNKGCFLQHPSLLEGIPLPGQRAEKFVSIPIRNDLQTAFEPRTFPNSPNWITVCPLSLSLSPQLPSHPPPSLPSFLLFKSRTLLIHTQELHSLTLRFPGLGWSVEASFVLTRVYVLWPIPQRVLRSWVQQSMSV